MDIENFRATGTNLVPKRPRRMRRGKWFLKGPIAGAWLSRAASLPGKALHVGLAAWHVHSLASGRPAKLTARILALFGVGRWAANRGLDVLSKAGLIDVERASGRSPVVTIREATELAEDR